MTKAGQKRYGSMSGEKLYNELKGQVQSERGRQYGFSSRWKRRTSIGENSEKVIKEQNRKRDNYEVDDPNEFVNSIVFYEAKGKNWLNKGSKDLSIAYLKDLGYSDKVAKDFVDRMAKSNKALSLV